MKTKIRSYLSVSRILAVVGLLGLIVLSAAPIEAQTVTQGYGSDEKLQKGMIVRLKEDDATKIEALSPETIEKMYGVVVDPNDAPVTLSADGQKVFVATVGRFETLVSTQNGSIAPGDFVTISNISGIGMKAGENEPVIVGRAMTGYDGNSNTISSSEIKAGDATKKVNIGRVTVDIGVSRNPLLKSTEPNLPELLKRATETIAGKPVAPIKAYISVVIFIVSTVVAGSLMYGGVRSAITSIGRNPLSKKSIIRGMAQVIVTGLIVFISGIFGVYLLLKL